MYHSIKSRANGISCSGSPDELKKLQEMFPLHATDDQDTYQALEKHFNPTDPQHVRFLQQVCFKTPLAAVAKVYDAFRLTNNPKIPEPPISNYFENKNFISLRRVENWLDGKGEYPSLAKINDVKEQIAQALLQISEEYGYIPNLQRFLFYYPEYLIRVLRFKNRFFQERIQKTSEVTYLSSKNCCFAGIIAAVEMGSPYMIARMINMFLVRDGNPLWIKQKKYPEQFKPFFSLFHKIAVAPWSVNEKDLQFKNSNWSQQVYFDYITAGMFTMSMSTICLAMGLVPDQPCDLLPLAQMLEIKQKYDEEKFQSITNKQVLNELISQQIRNILSTSERAPSKDEVQEIQSKLVEPYMKQIRNRMSTHDLYCGIRKLCQSLGIPEYEIVNFKMKNNSFFHRHRDTIENGLEDQRKSDKQQDEKFECFKEYCIEGSNMTFNNFGKKQENTRVFRMLIQVMTYTLCGYHNEAFDYKKNIKLNADLSMPLKFYVRLLSISPLYINKQVLDEINHEQGSGWIECFDLGHLAIMVAENKAKLLMASFQQELFD